MPPELMIAKQSAREIVRTVYGSSSQRVLTLSTAVSMVSLAMAEGERQAAAKLANQNKHDDHFYGWKSPNDHLPALNAEPVLVRFTDPRIQPALLTPAELIDRIDEVMVWSRMRPV